MADTPKVIISCGDRLFSRNISEDETASGIDTWSMSSPIPDENIYIIFQIYQGVWLAVAQNGKKFNVYRTIDRKNFNLVKSMDYKIHGIFAVRSGHALICADDGWWIVTKTGLNWQAAEWSDSPISTSAAIILLPNGTYSVFAHSGRKIYRRIYPGNGSWAESYELQSTGRSNSVIAGGPAGILAADGNKLMRNLGVEDSWEEIQSFGAYIISSISVSDQSRAPVFFIVVEDTETNQSKIYQSRDLGDSVELIQTRFDARTAVKTVYPTGSGEKNSMVVFLGKKAGAAVYTTRGV